MQEHDIIALATGVRLQFDKARDIWMLLAPERAVKLDDIAAAILQEINGTKTIRQIANILAEKYNAPVDVIQKDVQHLLTTLRDKRMLDCIDA